MVTISRSLGSGFLVVAGTQQESVPQFADGLTEVHLTDDKDKQCGAMISRSMGPTVRLADRP